MMYFTLAHEMGHAIHTWYSNENQPYVYAGYKIFVAEVASTRNEALLIRYLLKQCKKKKERAYLLNHFLKASGQLCSVRPCLRNLKRQFMSWEQRERA